MNLNILKILISNQILLIHIFFLFTVNLLLKNISNAVN